MKKTQQPVQPPTAFLTAPELRQRWRVSAMFLWRLRRDGRLPIYKIGARGVRFSLADVQRIEGEAKA